MPLLRVATGAQTHLPILHSPAIGALFFNDLMNVIQTQVGTAKRKRKHALGGFAVHPGTGDADTKFTENYWAWLEHETFTNVPIAHQDALSCSSMQRHGRTRTPALHAPCALKPPHCPL